MKKCSANIFLLYILLLLLLLVGCTNKGGFPSSEDLPKNGRYSIILIFPEDENFEKPMFLQDYVERDIEEIRFLYFDSLDDKYSSLNIEIVPYYIFLNHKGIVFETANINEAELFYNQKVKFKRETKK